MADGYHVGDAYVQIVASFDGVQESIARKFAQIRDITVDVKTTADTQQFSREVEAAVARAGKSSIAVKMAADTRDLDSTIARKEAERHSVTVAVKADIARAKSDLDRFANQAAHKNITPVFDQEIVRRFRSAMADIQVDTTKAAELSTLAWTKWGNDLRQEVSGLADRLRSEAGLDKPFTFRVGAIDPAVLNDLRAAMSKIKAEFTGDAPQRLGLRSISQDAIEDLRGAWERIHSSGADVLDVKTAIDPVALGKDVDKAVKDAGGKVVDVDLVGKEDALKAQIARIVATKDTKLIEIDGNVARYEAKKAEILAKQDTKILAIDADIAKYHSKLAELLAQPNKANVDVQAKVDEYESRLKVLLARKNEVNVAVKGQLDDIDSKLAVLKSRRIDVIAKADADVSSAMAKLAALQAEADKIDAKKLDLKINPQQFNRALLIASAVTGAISAIGYVAPAAAAAVAAIPAALAGVGESVGTVLLGLHGITAAVKAMTEADQSQEETANRVASAQSSLQAAQQAADKASIDGAQRVADARRSLADAQENVTETETAAADRVQTAEETLATAQRDETTAQENLTRAREDAAQRLEDLGLQVSGAALDSERASLTLQKAQDALAQGKASGTSGLALEDLDLSAREAAQHLAEAQERYKDLQGQAAYAAATGVEGDQSVIAAHNAVDAATQRTQQSEKDLTKARQDGALQVQKANEQVLQAQEALTTAQRDAQDAQISSARSVADAQRNLTEALSAQQSKVAQAMANLSPAAQAFATFLHTQFLPGIRGIGQAVQESMLPGFESGLRTLSGLTPTLTDGFREMGTVLGGLAIAFANLMTSGPWRADLQTIMRGNATIMENFGDAGLHLLDVLRNLTVAAQPMIGHFAAIADNALRAFDAFIQGQRDSGELFAKFANAQDILKTVWTFLVQVGQALWNISEATAPLGKLLLEILGPFVQWVGELAQAHPLLTDLALVAYLAGAGLLELSRSIGTLTRDTATVSKAFDVIRGKLLGFTTDSEGVKTGIVALSDSTTTAGKVLNALANPIDTARTGLGKVRDVYNEGASAARTFFAEAKPGPLLMLSAAANNAAQNLEQVPRATESVGGAMRAMGTVTQSTLVTFTTGLGSMAASVESGLARVATAATGVGTVIARGLTSAVSGLASILLSPGGLWAIAITGAVTLLGMLEQAHQDAARDAQLQVDREQQLADALRESNGAIDDNVRATAAKTLQDFKVSDGSRNLLSDVRNLVGSQGIPLLTNAYLGNGQALDALKAQLQANVDAHYNMISAGQALFTNFSDMRIGASGVILALDDTGKANRQLLDILNGSGGTFAKAIQDNQDLAAANQSAATAEDKQTQALVTLNDTILGQIDKTLAYESAQTQLRQAQERVATAAQQYAKGSPEYLQAIEGENQAVLSLIRAAGDQAKANSTATDEQGKAADAAKAMVNQAIDLANHYKGPLPEALQTYLNKLGIVQDKTGTYVATLNSIPSNKNTDVTVNLDAAQHALDEFKKNNADLSISARLTPQGAISYVDPSGNLRILGSAVKANAAGGILEFFAAGGFAQMNSGVAQVVPPNTLRVIGDRSQDDEAYIPINQDPRSIAILGETAARMGFHLTPLAMGAVLGFADGGIATGTQPVSPTGVPLTADQVSALAAAVAALTVDITAWQTAVVALHDLGLVPLVTELSGPVDSALSTVEAQGAAAWTTLSSATGTAVTQMTSHLAVLDDALTTAGRAFGGLASMVQTMWAAIVAYAAGPVRDLITGPLDAGLVAAWNYLDGFFALNRHLNPIVPGFASGGQVGGQGNQDTELIWATPGEIVIRKDIAEKYRDFLLAFNAGQPEAISAAGPAGNRGPRYQDGGIVADTGSQLDAAVGRGLAFAKAQDGKPYVWGGVGPDGYDCSGLMSALTNVLRGEPNPYQRLGVAQDQPWPGFLSGLGSAFATGFSPVHTAGTLAGVNIESTGTHVRFAGDAHGADDPQFAGHAYLPIVGGKFVSGGIGGFNPRSIVDSAFAATYAMVGQYLATHLATLGYGGGTMARQATDGAAGAAVNAALTAFGATGSAGSPAVVNAVRMVASQFGWGSGPEWNALSWIIGTESSWNPNAANPTSSARGLFQELTSIYGPVAATPAGQAEWALPYIKDRYGDPINAQAFHLAHGWYDDGGWLPPGYTLAANHTGRPEAVLTDQQWNALIRMSTQNSAPTQITVYARTDASPQHIAHAVDRHLAIGTRL